MCAADRPPQTAASLGWFAFAMVLHPHVQQRAHAELDSVVGRDRLPTMADWKNLPYIEALVKELLRWRPVAPLSIPRRNTQVSRLPPECLCGTNSASAQDDWYNGYFIPRGTS